MNNLVYFWGILAGPLIVIVSCAIGDKLSLFLRTILIEAVIMINSWSYSLVGL